MIIIASNDIPIRQIPRADSLSFGFGDSLLNFLRLSGSSVRMKFGEQKNACFIVDSHVKDVRGRMPSGPPMPRVQTAVHPLTYSSSSELTVMSFMYDRLAALIPDAYTDSPLLLLLSMLCSSTALKISWIVQHSLSPSSHDILTFCKRFKSKCSDGARTCGLVARGPGCSSTAWRPRGINS